jgi:hypothetical protein
MNQNFLKIIHKTLLTRSIRYHYNQIPYTLPSINTTNPSKYQVCEDYYTLAEHFNHPVFREYVPTYEELSKNQYTPWINRYISRNL